MIPVFDDPDYWYSNRSHEQGVAMIPVFDDPDYWYSNRAKLEEGQIFRLYDGDFVKLDRRVPCDGTQWYVASWYGKRWSYEDAKIEPGDLRGEPIENFTGV